MCLKSREIGKKLEKVQIRLKSKTGNTFAHFVPSRALLGVIVSGRFKIMGRPSQTGAMQ